MKRTLSWLAIAVFFLTGMQFHSPLQAQQLRLKIPVTLVDSIFDINTNALKKVKIFPILSFGVTPSATRCVDFPASFDSFLTHWTIADTGLIQENGYPGDPPNGERFVWDLSGCSDGRMFYDNLLPFSGTADKDTFKLDVGLDNDATFLHHPSLYWPSVLSEYFDTCKLIRNFGLGTQSTQADMGAVSSFTVPQAQIPPGVLTVRYTVYIHGFKTPPGPPAVLSAISPVDGATLVALNPTLSWNVPAQGAFYYGLQVSTSPNFTSFIFNDTLSASSMPLSGLQAGSDYYWRVYVQNQYGASYFQNPPFHFKTLTLTNPAPPRLSPIDNATGVSTNPTLVWNHGPADNIGYRLQVSTVPTFTTTVVDDNTLTDTSKTIGPLTNCSSYYWRLSAKNAAGFGPFSATNFVFTVSLATPAIPVLTSPASNANVSITPTLTWTGDICSQTYRLQVATDIGFSSLVVNQVIATASKQVGPLAEDVRYYWRVKALNSVDSSAYASVDSFKTILSPPGVPVLVTPANGDITVAPTPLFTWNKISNAATYEIQVASDAGFTAIVDSSSGLTDTTRLSAATLQNCQQYFWRVRAKNATGSSAFSTVRNFKVQQALPSAPSLVSPADAALDVSQNLTVSWTDNGICTSYFILTVALDTNFTSVFERDSLTATTKQLHTLGSQVKYFWKVEAGNTVGTAPSPTFTFTTILSPPGIPALVSPANADTTVSANVVFKWNLTNASFYYIQVATDAGFTSIVQSDSTVTDTTKQFGALLQNCQRYFWRVRSKNTAGISAFSAVRNFKVLRAVPSGPALIIPADGATGVVEVPTLNWTSNDLCLKYYILTVSTDVNFATIFERDSLTGTSKTISPLGSLKLYYWKVEGGNELGKTASAVFSFTSTAATTPIPPLLQSPANGQGGLSINPTLVWDTSSRAASYRLQVAYDINFTQIAKNDSTITQPGSAQVSKQIGPLLNSRTYYWRVNAKNGVGTSAYSDTFSFSTLFPPAAPVLISPANGAIDVPVSPQFTWTVPDRAELYRLQISTDTGFVVMKYDDSTLTETNWTIGIQLKGFTKYYWRVTAKNSIGYGASSSRSSFTTARTGAPNWAIPISVCETGPACDTVYFGILPNATYGIDPAVGEYELPQAPPFGWFDARFIDNRVPSMIGEGLRINSHPFRYYAQVDTFRIKFQPGTGSYPMTISWLPGFISSICDSMVIKDEFGGATVRQHMENSSSVTLSNSNISTLLIIEYGAFPILPGVKPPVTVELPKGFALSQNYPNPFNPTTRIQFSAEKTAQIKITVYDVLGREIRKLSQSTYAPGTYNIEWNGMSDEGHQMPSGLYYVRMIGTNISNEGAASVPFVGMKKMIMMK